MGEGDGEIIGERERERIKVGRERREVKERVEERVCLIHCHIFHITWMNTAF